MEKSHNHDHNHSISTQSINRAFYIGIGLNAIFTLVEFIVGFTTDSLALISDASHNLSDVAGLIIALIGMRLAKKAASLSYTYGYKKASILASLINAIFLIIVVIGIFREALERLSDPPAIEGVSIMIVAGVGVIINALSAFLFFKDQHNDINIRAAFLHLMVDALVSVGVVVSGLIIRLTEWNYIDPIISLIIAAIIFFSTWGLLKESIRLVIDAVPKSIDTESIVNKITAINGVRTVHHVHIWALSSSENALSAHIILHEESFNNWLKIKQEIHHLLRHEKINHVTLEHEIDDQCDDEICC